MIRRKRSRWPRSAVPKVRNLVILLVGLWAVGVEGAGAPPPGSIPAGSPGPQGPPPVRQLNPNRHGNTWASIARLPDLTGGIWGPVEQTLAETIALDSIAYPPLKPAQLAISKQNVQDIIDGKTDQPSAGCRPPGIPWSLWYAYGLAFLYTPGAVIMVTPGIDSLRTVLTDGSALPASLSDPDSLETPPTHLGYSIGHWEGDTLVVETRGLSPDNLVAHGVPNGGGMSIVERYRLIGPNRLQLRMTVDAPKVLIRPWQVEREFVRGPLGRLDSEQCDPNASHEKLDASGHLTLDLTPPSERQGH